MTIDRTQVAAFIRERRVHNTHKDLAIEIAKRLHGVEFAKAVADTYAKSSRGVASARFEAQRLFRQRLKEQGIELIRIPEKSRHVQAAVQALIGHVDEGKKPSALRAAQRPDLSEKQSKKLAYGTSVKRELVQAAVDVRSDSPFVQKMLDDAGMTDIIVNGHVSLSKLAGVLSNANRSLAQRVQHLEAAVIFLAGEVQAQRNGGNSRGHWHPQALQLREQGKSMNQIARMLGRSTGAVKQLLSRNAKAAPN
jgi:hypothetical protein